MFSNRSSKRRSPTKRPLRRQARIEALETRVVMDYAAAVQADNPVAFWRFNETSGTTAANIGSLGAGANGTYTGAVTLNQNSVNNSFGRAADFTGGYVSTINSNTLGLTNNVSWTAEAWVKADATNGDRTVFGTAVGPAGTDQGLHLIVRDGNIMMGFYGDDLGGPAFSANQWHHVVWRYDTTINQQSIFVDGVPVAVRTAGGDFGNPNGPPLEIGRWNSDNSRLFDGMIDEVAVYNTALSPARILAHYNAAYAPAIVNDTGSVNEDGPPLVVAAPGITANDSPAPVIVLGATTPVPGGTVTTNYDGSYTFNPNGAFESLAQGQTANATFTYSTLTAGNIFKGPVVLAPTGPGGTWNAYFRNSVAMEFDQARAFAQTLSFYGISGHLVSIGSGLENTIARAAGGYGDVYIGLTDLTGVSAIDGFNYSALGTAEFGNTSGQAVPNINTVAIAGQRGAGFRWVDGTPVTYNRWNGGEPNDAGGEDAIQFTAGAGDNGYWNDLPAGPSVGQGSATRQSIIEFDLNAPSLASIFRPGFILNIHHAPDSGLNNGNMEADAVIQSTNNPGRIAGSAVITRTDLSDDVSGSSSTGPDVVFPGLANGVDDDNFTSQVVGTFTVSAAADYRFRIGGDDGGRLRVDGQDVIVDNTYHGFATFDSPIMNLSAGVHTFEWTFFEGGGGGGGEMFFDNLSQAGGFEILTTTTSQNTTAGTMTATVYRAFNGNIDLNNVADAENLISGTQTRGERISVTALAGTINLDENASNRGQFTGDFGVPGVQNGMDDYALEATGQIYIPAAGDYTFAVDSEEGFQLVITGATLSGANLFNELGSTTGLNGALRYNGNRGAGTTGGTFNFPSAGFYSLRMVSWNRDGQAAFELSAASGSQASFNSNFRLVGDVQNGGLAVFTSLPTLANANGSGTVTITVNGQNDAPTAVVSAIAPIAEGQSLTLNASGSSDIDAGTTLTYSWDVNGDGVYGDATGVNPTLTWAQLQALSPPVNQGGNPATTYNVRVRTSDGFTSTTSAAQTLTVNNSAPTASISGDAFGAPNQVLSFDFFANDPSNTGAGSDQAAGFIFNINFGDAGNTADNGPTPAGTASGYTRTHAFSAAGTYTVTVTATDKDGATSVVATYNVFITPVVQVGSDLIAGGSGLSDNILFAKAAGGITVKVNGKTFGPFFGIDRVVAFGGGSSDTISAGTSNLPASFVGGIGNDKLVGGNQNDELDGGDGNDTLQGVGGDDTLTGGIGIDNMDGGLGNDTMTGGDGNDKMNGGKGDDFMYGDAGNDSMTGDAGRDVMHGGDDNDTINAGNDDDVLLGDAGNDRLLGGAGNDVLIGGLGADRLEGQNGNDLMAAGTSFAESDTDDSLLLYLADWSDFSDSSAFEPIDSDGEADTLIGGSGTDFFFADTFQDRITDLKVGSGDQAF